MLTLFWTRAGGWSMSARRGASGSLRASISCSSVTRGAPDEGPPSRPRSAVMLTSGGVDSVTTAYYVKHRLKAPKMILVFADYGQRTYDYEKFCIEAIGKELWTRP